MTKTVWTDILCIISCIAATGLCIYSYANGLCSDYERNTGLVCGVFCLIPIVLGRLHIIAIPDVLIVLALGAICLHSLGVLYFTYDELYFYDNITHSVSSAAVTACVFLALTCYNVVSRRIEFRGRMVMIAVSLIMLSFSVYWEVFEYLVDSITGTGMQYNPLDTARDMICNTVASFATAAFMQYYVNRKTPEKAISDLDLHPLLKRFIVYEFKRSFSPAVAVVQESRSDTFINKNPLAWFRGPVAQLGRAFDS